MTMFALQYGGAALIISGYWFMMKDPVVSTVASFLGCVLCGFWAFYMSAWGILAIEIMCASISLRNAWDAGGKHG